MNEIRPAVREIQKQSLPRFGKKAQDVLSDKLQAMLQIVNIGWQFTENDDVLILDFLDEEVNAGRVEFGHPNSAFAYIDGFMRGVQYGVSASEGVPNVPSV